MKHSKTLFAIALFTLAVQCMNRDRVNPLDPRNSDTNGIPAGLKAFSLGRDVTVSWDSIEAADLLGYNLYRRKAGENFERIAMLDAATTSYTDAGLLFDSIVTYRFSLRGDGYESTFSDSVVITPGPHQFWITDFYGGGVFRLTYDGMHLISSSLQDIFPTAVAVDTVLQSVWVADATGYLVQQNYEGEALNWYFTLFNPSDIEWDGLNGNLWVINNSRSDLVQMDLEGNMLQTFAGFERLERLEIDPNSGGCWVTDSEGHALKKYGADGALVYQDTVSFNYPGAMAYNNADNWLWLADSLYLFKVFQDGNTLRLAQFDFPIEFLASDPWTGNCWGILERGEEYNDVVQVGTDGTILSRTEGFYWARSLAPIPFNGGCLVTDPGNGRLVRLNSQGIQAGEMFTLDTPWEIKLENY